MAENPDIVARNFELAMRAATEADLPALQQLMRDNHIDPNTKDPSSGQTLLHKAAFGGNMEMVKYLLAQGAKIDSGDNDKLTPFLYLVGGGNFSPELANLFVEKGANINISVSGNNALSVATSNTGVPASTIDWLATHGIDLNKPVESVGEPPIMAVIKSKNIDMLKTYLRNGVDFSTRDSSGSTILHQAVATLRPDIVALVLEESKKHGVDLVNAKNFEGTTPFLLATNLITYPQKSEAVDDTTRGYIAKQMKIVQQLADAGADVNTSNLTKITPVMLAAAKGNDALMPFLLEKGADITAHDTTGRTAYTFATASGRQSMATLLTQKMLANEYYKTGATALPQLDGNHVVDSLVANGTDIPVYTLDKRTEEFRHGSAADVAALQNYQQKRQANLLIVESESSHQKSTSTIAVDTYTHLTGTNRAKAEQFIAPVNQGIENLGNFANGSAPTSQYSEGFRALMEAQANAPIREKTYLSSSYYTADEASLHYQADKGALLNGAAQFYSSLDIAGVGIANGNDAQNPNLATLGKSQPFRANAGTVFVGAAEKTADGYVMKAYSEQGAHITAPLPPYYNKVEGTLQQGTSFSTPAFNAYRLALYNGTEKLTPREVDAALFMTASQNVVDDNAKKPYPFVNNGVISYNEKVGYGVADIGAAYTRAKQMDTQKKEWLQTHGEDLESTLHLTADTTKPTEVRINGAAKYSFTVPITEDVYIQQLTTKTLTPIDADGKPGSSEVRVIMPSGFTEHARDDAYGNASIPAAFGMKLKKGDSITILSDQPLGEASVTIDGYATNSFFASQIEQQRTKLAAQGLNKIVISDAACTAVAANVYNAKAEPCAVAAR